MATVTDVLETLFVAKGVEAYTDAYNRAIQKNDQLARKNDELIRKGKQPGSMLDPTGFAKSEVISNLAQAGTVILAAGAALRFLNESVREFAKSEDVMFRATVTLNNLGSSLRPERLKEMAAALRDTTALDDEPLVAAGTALARFGFSGQVTEKTLRSIADAAEATGLTVEQVSQALGRGAHGNSRTLLRLGIAYKATGDKAKDFNNILEEFDKRFAGAAEARRNTPAGAIDAMTVAIGNFKESFGEAFSGVVIPMLNAATALINMFTQNADKVAGIFATMLGGPLGDFFLKMNPYKPSYQNIGKGGAGLATEETLKQVAKNTEKMSDAFVRQVLGGPGTVARGSFTLRDARLAFGS